jgi:protein involved in polysaccharide export with SLBB domain
VLLATPGFISSRARADHPNTLSTPRIADFVRAAALALPALLATGCASPGPALGSVIPQINATYSWAEEHLAPGDELEVHFAEHTTYDHTVVVRDTGTASFLGIGELHVGGSTPAQLEGQLVEKYSSTFAAPPRIHVQLRERAARHVVIMGEVTNPGPVVFDGRMTFQEAVGLAGGPLKDTALLKQTLLVRWVGPESKQRAWKFDARERHWGTAEPLYLQPDDVVFIPNTPIDDVDIWVEQYIRRLLPFPLLIPVGGG